MRALDQTALDSLRKAGIPNAELVKSSSLGESFDNSEAVFRVGSILIRFVRDRGQEFIDVASVSGPERFHQFDDLAIAMGWTTTDSVLARTEPERLEHVLSQLAQHLRVIEEGFSGKQEFIMRSRIEKAAKERGEAFMQRLRRVSNGGQELGSRSKS